MVSPLFVEKCTSKFFNFGGQKSLSLKKARFRIPYTESKVMDLELDVVDVNVPLLVGLEVLDIILVMSTMLVINLSVRRHHGLPYLA